MGRIKLPPPEPPEFGEATTPPAGGKKNLLTELFLAANTLPIICRQQICKHCAWSTPTFYRKLRNGDISNAEISKIKEIYIEQFNDFLKLLQ